MRKEVTACGHEPGHQLAADWYTHFQGTIRSALTGRVKRPADVDDLSHEVYLRLLKVPDPESVQNPQAYVYRVAINVAEEWKQRAVQKFSHSSDSLPTLVSDYGPEDWFRQQEQHTLVKKKLAGIPVSSRTALMLHVRDGKSYEEIALHMNVTRRAVKRYMSKGYGALRKELHKYSLLETA
ncbi:MAG: sigma-70 family RNA polymerase sigma factor [Pseudomonadota bacterium]